MVDVMKMLDISNCLVTIEMILRLATGCGICCENLSQVKELPRAILIGFDIGVEDCLGDERNNFEG